MHRSCRPPPSPARTLPQTSWPLVMKCTVVNTVTPAPQTSPTRCSLPPRTQTHNPTRNCTRLTCSWSLWNSHWLPFYTFRRGGGGVSSFSSRSPSNLSPLPQPFCIFVFKPAFSQQHFVFKPSCVVWKGPNSTGWFKCKMLPMFSEVSK